MIQDNEQKSAISLLRAIIVREMELDPDRVIIYNQKWNIPADDGIFVTLSFLGAKPMSSRSREVQTESGMSEVQEVNMQEMIQIDVMSKSTAALFRKWEVLAALTSVYSQQIQEQNSFKIAILPTDLKDVSEVEGTARLYRFVITVNLFAWYEKTKAVDFYDSFKFKLRVLTENSDTGEIDQPQPDPEE